MPAKKKAPARAAKPVADHAQFMARAYQMELDAEARYDMLADQMETHHNAEVAALFRKLSRIEGKHAKKILGQMKWKSVPALPAAFPWQGFESPEAVPADEPHYLMQPWHALKLALECEQRAQRYFEQVAKQKVPASVRKAALEMADDEREHVRLIEEWMARVPEPEPGWDRDPDPPTYSE
jgi:rubrerythrin